MTPSQESDIYRQLMRFKPEDLSANAWAVRAGVSRTVWADMRRHGNPSRRTLEKLLGAVGSSLAEFEARFRGGAVPENMPEVRLATAGAGIAIAQLVKQANVVESTSEALRLIAQRGLKVDGAVVTDKALTIPAGSTVVVQAGKRRFARVVVS